MDPFSCEWEHLFLVEREGKTDGSAQPLARLILVAELCEASHFQKRSRNGLPQLAHRRHYAVAQRMDDQEPLQPKFSSWDEPLASFATDPMHQELRWGIADLVVLVHRLEAYA